MWVLLRSDGPAVRGVPKVRYSPPVLSALLRFSGKGCLNLRLAAAPGFETHLMERPALWMSDAQLAQLAADLRQVAGRTLPASELTYGVFSGDRAALSRSVITLVRRKADGAPVAFNALALMDLRLGTRDVQVLHLGLVMVDPEERSRGLSWVLYGLTCFVLLLRGGGRPIWVSNVTQVPAVVGMVADTFAQVYPAPQATANRPGRRSLTHLLLARQIMADHRHVFGVGADAGFDEDRFVITNAYTGGSDALKKRFDQATPHRDPAYNDFCAGMLDYDRGDDLLQLGQVDLPTALSYLARDVPRRSVAGLAVAGLGIAVQRLALPALHWVDTSRPFGILRSRER